MPVFFASISKTEFSTTTSGTPAPAETGLSLLGADAVATIAEQLVALRELAAGRPQVM
jgi:hypothetical protein